LGCLSGCCIALALGLLLSLLLPRSFSLLSFLLLALGFAFLLLLLLLSFFARLAIAQRDHSAPSFLKRLEWSDHFDRRSSDAAC
jgi:hypothetical protein